MQGQGQVQDKKIEWIFLGCEFSRVQNSGCTVVATAETSENPGTLEVEQQAAK